MDVYVWRADVFVTPEPPDLTGWDVEATDAEHIGKVDHATYENGAGSLVVDTGFWIFGKKRSLPAGVVEAIDPQEKKVYISMSKADVKGAPDYDPERHRDDEPGYLADERAYYEEYGTPAAPTPPRSG